MINPGDYLDPVSIEKPATVHIAEQSQFSRNLIVHTENNPVSAMKGYKMAIIGVPDDRMSPSRGSALAPDAIRRALYPMARIPGKLKIADLGNLKPGVTFNDTLAGLTDLIQYLDESGVFTILIGGTSSIIQAVDKVFETRNSRYCLTSVDSLIDYNPDSRDTGSCNALAPLLHSSKSRLSHFISIGYQTYLNDPQVITRLKRKQYDLMRLGDVRQAIHLTEPLLRDSHVIMLDVGAIRQSDAPGSAFPSPNGLYGEEACLLARYSGVSDKLKLFCVTEVNPARDIYGQTVSLAAQILWFFMESFAQKQVEDPSESSSGNGRFTKYHINVDDLGEEMIFVRSNYTDRWWIEMADSKGIMTYAACSYEDYLKANNNEVPERWIMCSARLKS